MSRLNGQLMEEINEFNILGLSCKSMEGEPIELCKVYDER